MAGAIRAREGAGEDRNEAKADLFLTSQNSPIQGHDPPCKIILLQLCYTGAILFILRSISTGYDGSLLTPGERRI